MRCCKLSVVGLGVICFYLLSLTQAVYAEIDESWRFVDARSSVGYYVDTKTITTDSDHEYTADVIIIRAEEDLLFRYRMHFDYEAHTYQMFQSSEMRYETGELIQSYMYSTPAESYADGSPIQAVVDFIDAWQKGYER